MKEFTKKFNSFERNFIYETIEDVQVWELIREKVFNVLYSEIKNVSAPNTADKDKSALEIVKSMRSIFFNSIQYFFTPKKKVEYLFVNHPRKKNVNGSFQDIYTDPIIDDLKGDYLVLEGLFQMKHLKPSYQKNVLYADIFDFWPRLISLFWIPKLSNKELEFWKELEVKILNEFNIKIELTKKIKREYLRAKISIWGIKKLLKKIQPRLIIEVVGYSRLSKHVNIAAKELGITTIELQHGYISEAHPAYNYPNDITNIKSFPDYIGVWSDFYRNKMKPPVAKDKIITCGFKYFEDQLKRVNLKDNQSILFVSQGTIGNKLGSLAKELAKELASQIIYKLHPGEVQDAKNRYSDLYNVQNLKVDDNIASDLYQRIIEAEIVIGVYSTALIEAASLGKKVIIVGLPGWKNFEELIEDDSFPLIYAEANVKSLLSRINDPKILEGERNYKLIESYNDTFLRLQNVN